MQDLPIGESKERNIRQENADTSTSPMDIRFANSITGLEGASKDLDLLHLTSKPPSIKVI